MAKVLVLGVDSMLGANLALTFAREHDCVGLYHAHSVEPADCVALPCNLTDPSAVLSAVRTIAPQWVVYCGETARGAWDPLDAGRNEVGVVRQLSEECSAERIALTAITSDAVFTGPRLFHEESCQPTGSCPSATAVRAVEEALRGTQALVARTHAYGWSAIVGETNFAESLADRLRAVETVTLDGVRYATPILATDLAELLLRSYELGLKGLYHISGAERTNPDRFAAEMAFAFDITCRHSRLQAVERAPAAFGETSLNTRRARRDLGRAMPLLREGLDRFAAQAANGHLERLRRAAQPAVLKTVAA